jgi:4-hydroxy-tetrahydrodipicolinate synthase
VPPSEVSHDSERYREYLYALADGAPCPLILYEWPQAPNYLMAPELFGELAQKRLIAGLKDTTCTYDGIRAKQAVAAEAVVYQANTPLLLDALAMGVRGIMAVTSTARADLAIRLWRQFHEAPETATAVHRELVFLDALLRMAYPATAKYLVSLQGVKMPLATRWPGELAPEMMRAIEVWNAGLAAKGPAGGARDE